MHRKTVLLTGSLLALAGIAVALVVLSLARDAGRRERAEGDSREGPDRRVSRHEPRVPPAWQRQEPAGVGGEVDPPGSESIDVRELLGGAAEPTAERLTTLVRRVFELPDPRRAVDDTLELLAAGKLSFEEGNAACVLLEAALRIYDSDAFRERFGDGHASELVARVLERFASLGDEAAQRMALVIAEGGFLGDAHHDALGALLSNRPIPPGAVELLAGLGDDHRELVLGYLDSDVAELREVAVERLLSLDEDFLPVVEGMLRDLEGRQDRAKLLHAIARAGEPSQTIPLLRSWMRGAIDDPERGDLPSPIGYLPLFLEVMSRTSPGEARFQLESETDPAVRSLMIQGLGGAHRGLLLEIADGPGDAASRGAALVRLSTMSSVDGVGEILVRRLDEAGSGVRDPALVTVAANLLDRVPGGDATPGWVGDARIHLLEWVRDPAAALAVRRDALEALLPVLDAGTRSALAAEPLPDELREILP